MPDSMAACSTVVPFGTEIARPSIVSVTVSISLNRHHIKGLSRKLKVVEERQFRIVPSIFEWVAAALAVVGLAWMLSGPVQRLLGPRAEATLVDQKALPPGVPAGATVVPVMLL